VKLKKNKLIFYHGTTLDNYDKILNEKILFGKRGKNINRCTYLATDFNEAKNYGTVVLEVKYNPFRKPALNNFKFGCWQFRVYEPIGIKDVFLLY